MKKLILFFLLAVSPLFCFAQNGVVISQVQIEGDNGANDEFVEIYNSSDACVSLDGWSLQYKTSSGDFPLSLKKSLPAIGLPAKAKYLAARSEYNGSAAADLVYSSFSLSGGAAGASIFLSNSISGVSGTDDVSIIDRFAYGNSASNTPLGSAPLVPVSADKPAADWAFVRTGFSENNALDFSLQASLPENLASFQGIACTSPTTTAELLATTTPDLEAASSTPKNLNIKIYQFLPDPAGDDAGSEWVELKNQGTEEAVLDGWLLDDKNTGSGPAADAYVLSGPLSAGEVKRFVIPLSHFALNNTGGDEVNLYFSDKSLADSAVYSASAYSDGIFEFINSAWQPPAQITGSTGGSSGGAQTTVYSGPADFRVNEVFPNPPGEDVGSEWVELFNIGAATTSLEGFFLGVGESAVWSSGAYELPKLSVAPGGFLKIIFPKDSVTLKNSGKEKVNLFNPLKQLVGFAEYSDAPENRSWQKRTANLWEWGVPTPGEANIVPGMAEIIFSEILPVPEIDQDEFIELYNLATTTVNLRGFVLNIGTRSKTFSENDVILPESYLTLFPDDLPVALRNSGQKVVLHDNWERLVAGIEYPPAQKGQSFASLDGKEFFWTASVTPGASNQIVLGDSLKEEIKKPVSAPVQVKKSIAKTAEKTDANIAEALMQKNEDLSFQLAALQETVDELNKKLDNLPDAKQSPSQELIWWEGGKYLVLALACGIFLFWLLKFLSQGPSGGGKL